jgi:hypothetical protein
MRWAAPDRNRALVGRRDAKGAFRNKPHRCIASWRSERAAPAVITGRQARHRWQKDTGRSGFGIQSPELTAEGD